MENSAFERHDRVQKSRKSYDSFSLGSISISSEELELFNAIERNKKKQLENSFAQSFDVCHTENKRTPIVDNRSSHEFYGSFEEEKRDYHEKNQLFLQKLAQQHPRPARNFASPQRDCPRSIYLSHPPTTGFSHRRLESIDNDVWDEEDSSSEKKELGNPHSDAFNDDLYHNENVNDSNHISHTSDHVICEKQSHERRGHYEYQYQHEDDDISNPPTGEISFEKIDFDEYNLQSDLEDPYDENSYYQSRSEKKRKKKKKAKKKRKQKMDVDYDELFDSFIDSSVGSQSEKEIFMSHEELVRKWMEEAKAEYKAEEAARRAEEFHNRWYNRFYRTLAGKARAISCCFSKMVSMFETSISNIPLTIGALSLAIVTLGTVWFKFAEENLNSCVPTHFHTTSCTYHEYPGCFSCDVTARWYKIAFQFHSCCSFLAFILAFTFLLKVVFATRVIVDEMSSPTLSAPAGLMCVAMVSVFAGRGWVGEIIVVSAAIIHFLVALLFGYMALAYRILPDPSWFPNTVSIGYCGVKLWTYFPLPGICYMLLSLVLFLVIFPISVFRVYFNQKIGAPVCWLQASAPSIVLYALTLIAQPMHMDDPPMFAAHQSLFQWAYLNVMHMMFFFCLIGMGSSIHSLKVRWKDFKKKEFSPAHAAFGFPPLSHANAIQSYRGALDSYSTLPKGGTIKLIIYWYWLFVLVAGTLLVTVITIKYFYHLPGWVLVDTSDEEEPPAPTETMIRDFITTGETMKQNYINPAILQANETGALVVIPQQDGSHKYRRTRRVTALGFEPIMNMIELETERQVLLDWVEHNNPRTRSRTLSVPVDVFNLSTTAPNQQAPQLDGDDGAGQVSTNDHRRSKTMSYV